MYHGGAGGCFVTPGLWALCIIITVYDILRNSHFSPLSILSTWCGLSARLAACVTCQPGVILIRSLQPCPPPPPPPHPAYPSQVKPAMPLLPNLLSFFSSLLLLYPSSPRFFFFSIPGPLLPPSHLSLSLQLLAIFTLYGSFMMAPLISASVVPR